MLGYLARIALEVGNKEFHAVSSCVVMRGDTILVRGDHACMSTSFEWWLLTCVAAFAGGLFPRFANRHVHAPPMHP